jgi:hypothetical protein
MAYEAGALEATLQAAAGGDATLFSELRTAYVDGVARQVDLLERSRCDGNWSVAAMRLKGLAASFHSEVLLSLAEEALDAAPGEPTVVRRLKTYVAQFADLGFSAQ